MNKSFFTKLLIILIFILGIGLRLYNIRFGLPHSFYADEPEIVELAIKYTYEFRDIIKNNNAYKLVPISYVYGTFPSYLFTITTMVYSKTSNFFHIPFDKTDLYIAARSFGAILTMLIPVTGALLYKRSFRDTFGAVLAFILLTLNWKFIVHAHYVNPDVLQTVFILISMYFMYIYLQKHNDTIFTVLAAVFFGLAVGTKITTLITLPVYLLMFLRYKEYRNFFSFLFIVYGTYIVTNPFSLIFAQDFAYRIVQMKQKEAGMVFDSVDSNPFKYIHALSYMLTLPVFIFSIYGMLLSVKKRISEIDNFHIFLIGNVIIYLLFFSLQPRRVDRWLLPILPVMLIYGSFGLSNIKRHFSRFKTGLIYITVTAVYLYFPILLLSQFQTDTPKSKAYIWMRDNIPETSWKLVYTEEGLDPMNKLSNTEVYKYNVYTTENAQFFLPQDPFLYDYVVISSRPLENYRRPEVKNAYGFYYDKWKDFEDTVTDSTKFTLIKEFTLPKPNLIPLSDVYIYKNNIAGIKQFETKKSFENIFPVTKETPTDNP